MKNQVNVYILAAGLGTRLSFISQYLPKPLLPILGKPILQQIIEKTLTLSPERILINLHYKRHLMMDWIFQSPYFQWIDLFMEEPILGTGGALKNAEDLLKDSHFLLHNADILSAIDLKPLVELHLASNNLATLAVHHYDKFNNILVDKNGFYRGLSKTPDPTHQMRFMAFTGISVYSPKILELIQPGFSSVVSAWNKAIQQGYPIGTYDVTGCYWNDIGTPDSYMDTIVEKLKDAGEMNYIDPSAKVHNSVEMVGNVSVERNSVLLQGASLKNCVVLPATKVERGQKLANSIVGPDFIIQLNNLKRPPVAIPFGNETYATEFVAATFGDSWKEASMSLIVSGGSDRHYFRVVNRDSSVVLMVCKQDDGDFDRHIQLTRYFCQRRARTPKLIAVRGDRKMAIFEDLGDQSLYTTMKYTHSDEDVELLYQSVIDLMIMIHNYSQDDAKEFPALTERQFDYDHARWETSYFMERFVRGVYGVTSALTPALEDEFHALALATASLKRTLIHRDFQSQNIMLRQKNNMPVAIDFQGARQGPPAYDLASLLWDPYVALEQVLREKLTHYYIAQMKAVQERFDENDFMDSLLTVRLQRHMQALGAYGFLSLIKGKTYFLKHIPSALEHLKEETALCRHAYPALYELVSWLKPVAIH